MGLGYWVKRAWIWADSGSASDGDDKLDDESIDGGRMRWI